MFRGGYGITQYMEGTGANLRLPLNPPFFFESQIDFAPPGAASTIATGFEGLQALDRPSGQLRAWDPNLRPQFTQQWNVFAEYLIGARSSINVGYVGNKSKHLVTPIEGNQPLPGVGRPQHLGAAAAAPSALPVQPADHQHQHDGLARARELQRAADHLQAAPVERPRLRRQLHAEQGEVEQPRLLRLGRTSPSEGAYPVNSYDIEANYGPAFFDAKHIVSLAGSYELPFGQGPQVSASNLNRALDAVVGGWGASFAVTAHTGYPITVQDSSNPSLQATRSTEWPDRIGDPVPSRSDPHALAESRRVPLGRARHVRQRRRRHRARARATGTSTCRSASASRPSAASTCMFRGEVFNVLNHPNFGPPDRNIQSQTFGTITGH